jgi:hypothetical protein
MPRRVCLERGCGMLTTRTRCPAHERQQDRRRGSTAQRGYGAQHQTMRRRLLPLAYGRPCPRCGQPILPGQALDLDHAKDRTSYNGIAHASCNRGKRNDAGQKGRGEGGDREREPSAVTRSPLLFLRDP